MQIRYALTRPDLFKWNLAVTVRQRALQVLLVCVLCFIWWSSYSFEENQDLSRGYRIYLASFSAVFALTFISVLVVIMGAISVLGRKYAGVLGEHTLEITEDGLVEFTAVNRTVHRWSGIHSLRRTRSYAFIHINEVMAHIVPTAPARVYGDVEAFLAEVKMRMQKAQPSATDNPDDAQRLREDH